MDLGIIPNHVKSVYYVLVFLLQFLSPLFHNSQHLLNVGSFEASATKISQKPARVGVSLLQHAYGWFGGGEMMLSSRT